MDTGEMPQQGKVLVFKPGEPTLILRSHGAEGENRLPKAVFLISTGEVHAPS